MLRAVVAFTAALAFATARGVTAFGNMHTTDKSVEEKCTENLQGLAKSCGDAVAGKVVPPVKSCNNGVCQLAVVAWWPMCKTLDSFSTIDNRNNHEITSFYDACEELGKPNCGACSGHASAQDTLPGDPQVLTAGSPQRASFMSLFVGEISNLLCVPTGQVHFNSVAENKAPSGTAPGTAAMGRSLAETGAQVSLQVSWTVDATTTPQAQSLVAEGQSAIGMPGMGRRQLEETSTTAASQCVVGQNKGALLATATAFFPITANPTANPTTVPTVMPTRTPTTACPPTGNPSACSCACDKLWGGQAASCASTCHDWSALTMGTCTGTCTGAARLTSALSAASTTTLRVLLASNASSGTAYGVFSADQSTTTTVSASQRVAIIGAAGGGAGGPFAWPGVFSTAGSLVLLLVLFFKQTNTPVSIGAGYVSPVSIISSYFTSNSGYNGGAVCITSGTVSIVSTYFISNTAEFSGGAVDIQGGTVSIVSSYFTSNTAGSNSGNSGSAIYVQGSANFHSVKLRDSVLRANDCKACSYPSALFVYQGAVATLSNVTFADNVPSGHAIDCSTSNDNGHINDYTGDAHFGSRVVDSGHDGRFTDDNHCS